MHQPQQPRTLALSGEALPTWGYGEIRPLLIPTYLHGTEAIGELFAYTVRARTDIAAPPEMRVLDLDAIVGTEVTVHIDIPGKSTFIPGMPGDTGMGNIGACTREISGRVSEARFVRCDERSMVYEFVLCPGLHEASLGRGYRLFQDRNVIEISEAVLRAYPFEVDLRIAGPVGKETTYPPRDLQRQYWESDARFLQRLWEEWGVFYWFEHEGGAHRLVLADTLGAFHCHGDAHETIRYAPAGESRTDEEHIDTLSLVSRQTAGKVTVVDHDYMNPRTAPGTTPLCEDLADPRDTARADQEVYVYGDVSQPLAGSSGLAGEPNDARREARFMARVRMEAIRCQGQRANGHGNLRGLTVGRTFHLVDHPYPKANQEYVVVSTTLTIEETDQSSGTGHAFRCETDFEIQPVLDYFRMPQKTSKPAQAGVEYAIVTGPQGHEIWTDAMGRVKVRFVADREGAYDETSSIWILPMQPWQNGRMGAAFVPRVGSQVAVAYVNGDPDLPFIVASSANQRNGPAWKLPFNQWVSGLRSRAAGGSSANHLALVDTQDELQAQVSSDHGASQLSLGFLRRLSGNDGLKDARGRGFELRTDLWGTLRAAMGLLISTHGRDAAAGKAKDMDETVARLTQARELHEKLAELARHHETQQRAGEQSDVTRAIKRQIDELRGTPGGGPEDFPEFAAPHLTLASPAGIETTTAGSTHIQSNDDLALTTGRHVGIAAGRSLYASVMETMAFFVRKAGMKLVAAAGKIRVEAQTDSVEVIARQAVELISTGDWINLNAAKGVRLNGGGTVLEISPAGILGSTNGKFLVHAASHATDEPQAVPAALPISDINDAKVAEPFVLVDGITGLRIPDQPYRITVADGQVIEGRTNAEGETAIVLADTLQSATVEFHHNDGTDNPVAIYSVMLTQASERTPPAVIAEKRAVRRVGNRDLQVNDDAPARSGHDIYYAVCQPYKWGMRYSVRNDKDPARLEFPVARQFALDLADVLLERVQWGSNYFGKSEPILTLTQRAGGIGFDGCGDLAVIIAPVVRSTLTNTNSGKFALPIDAAPTVIVTDSPLLGGAKGVFNGQDWSLSINTDALTHLFNPVQSDAGAPHIQAKKLLKDFVDTVYHETRHCQQYFWIYAMVQQQSATFLDTPNIVKWPGTATRKDNKLALKVVALSAHQPIHNDSLALAGVKQMAVGMYVWNLSVWRAYNDTARQSQDRKPWYPVFAHDEQALTDEYTRAYQQAKKLLSNAGAGGGQIDIDEMVADGSGRGYTSRPWENDSFYCGEIAGAYWIWGRAPDGITDEQCSRQYALAYNGRPGGGGSIRNGSK
ncbi:type VI secretion system tip protein VgrG [Paraburkholderia sp. Se-20369]|nr:type VI secretion system tip protein VgrG [Paraburkholderia sp. Se-20369]